MTLRLILVGLVTSMGLELPSGRDVACWAESGRAWVDARLAGLPASGIEVASADGSEDFDPADEPVGSPVTPSEPDADQAFQAAVLGVAADFASDRAPVVAEVPPPVTAPFATVAEVEAPAVGLPEGEELATLDDPVGEAVSIEEAAQFATGEDTAEALFARPDAPSRADRLSQAVRLTREAAQAWTDLLQDSTDEAGSIR